MVLSDFRIPVVFGPTNPDPDDARLVEGRDFKAQATHPPGCACCGQRTAAGIALAALLQARARGEVSFFRRVVVECATAAGRAQMRAALEQDPVASACFKEESR